MLTPQWSASTHAEDSGLQSSGELLQYVEGTGSTVHLDTMISLHRANTEAPECFAAETKADLSMSKAQLVQRTNGS